MIIKFNKIIDAGKAKLIFFVKKNSVQLNLDKDIPLWKAKEFINNFPKEIKICQSFAEEVKEQLIGLVEFEIYNDEFVGYSGPLQPEEALTYMLAKNWYEKLPEQEQKFVDVLVKSNAPYAG